MVEHVTQEELSQLQRSELGAEEIRRVERHTAQCPDCCRQVQQATMGVVPRLTNAFAPTAAQHLGYDEFEGLVDDSLTFDERAAAEKHLDSCAACRDEYASLAAFANMPEKQAEEIVTASSAGPFRAFFGWSWLPVAGSLALLVIATTVWYITRKGDQQLAAVPPPTTPAVEEQLQQPESDAQPAEKLPSAPPELATSLIDGNETVGVDHSGALVGYDGLSAAERSKVERVIKSGSLPVAPELRELRSTASATMGASDQSSERFDVVGPVGKVVATNHPVLRWKPLTGSTGYRVDVFDTNFNKVASSGVLSSTSWAPTLSDGRTYVWQVTAFKDGREIKAPVRPAPEARFKTVDRVKREQILALKQAHPNAHLPLAIAYAEAGLVDEARNELNAMLNKNRNSSLAKQLLRQLKSPH